MYIPINLILRSIKKNIFLIGSLSFFLVAFSIVKEQNLNNTVKQLKRSGRVAVFDSVATWEKIYSSCDSAEIELGKKLFFEKSLSKENNISCSSCHISEKGFSNGEAFGKGTHGNLTTRNVPHLYNLIKAQTFFWDGRANSLEEQLLVVLTSQDEMDITFDEVIERLKKNQNFTAEFSKIYPNKGITKNTITKAIVAYEKTILSFNSPYDDFIKGDTNALTVNQKKGMEIFMGKANCIACHNGANLTDNQFHNTGLNTSDIGRGKVDKIGMSKEFESTPYPFFSTFKAFKTPSLRNVSLSSPYFHSGSKKTLREVIEKVYNVGGENIDKTGLAKEIKPLGLDDQEISALVSFLESFTDRSYK